METKRPSSNEWVKKAWCMFSYMCKHIYVIKYYTGLGNFVDMDIIE